MSEFIQLFVLGLMEGALYAMCGACIVLVYKATEVASLAHGQLLAFGAIFFYVFYGFMELPLVVALLLTFLASGLLGMIIERVAMRRLIGQPLFAAFLVTFSLFMVMDGVLNIILQGDMLAFPHFLPTGHMEWGPLNMPIGQVVSFFISLALFGLLALLFKFTKIGLGMLATAENHQLAQSTGVRVEKIFSVIWILSAVVAAVAGMATANIMDIYHPLPMLGIKGLIVALFGGLDSLPGALLAGLFLGIFESVAAGYLDPLVGGGVKEVAPYVMLLLILLVKPYGLFGLVRIERI
ncbi:MAG: branched-chain amino acid ABC transporter permease [Deltaproteobacteria bacterium]|nr:branched-chain amino acid ABC transporter permease [Deltaproteobacteria bacterium]